MKSSKTILKAMDVIADESRWTQHTFARDKDDGAVGYQDRNACKFCVVGAVQRVAGIADQEVTNYLKEGFRIPQSKSIPDYNDRPTRAHSDIMKGMMTAAFLALSEGK